MMTYLLNIPLKPVAKGRPRFGRWGTYTPQKTAIAEDSARIILSTQFKREPIKKPIGVKFTFYFPIPKSYTKKQREAIEKNGFINNKKPDVDNLCKLYLDAMNGLVFKDDAQIWFLQAIKLYTLAQPRIEIEIDEGN